MSPVRALTTPPPGAAPTPLLPELSRPAGLFSEHVAHKETTIRLDRDRMIRDEDGAIVFRMRGKKLLDGSGAKVLSVKRRLFKRRC